MADTTINSSADAALDSRCSTARWVVSTASGVAYAFTINSSGYLVYHKLSGGSWGGENTVYNSQIVERFDIWYDKWTKGQTGTRINIVWQESGTDTVRFNALDVSDDTFDGEVQVYSATQIGTTDNLAYGVVSITRAVGGNLYVLSHADPASGTHGFYRSTDNGANWSSRSTTGVFESASGDRYMLMPGNESDNQDIYCFFVDITTGASPVTIKTHDDSGNSWSESSAILTVQQYASGIGQIYFASQRHSDGHILLAIATEMDTATADFVLYDITNNTTWSALTNPITDKDDWFYPSIFIDQNTDDLYACYVGKDDGSETINASVNTYYKKSTNDGSSWDTAVIVSETQDDHRCSSPPCGVGSDGGDLLLVWYNDDLSDILSNIGNMVSITAGATESLASLVSGQSSVAGILLSDVPIAGTISALSSLVGTLSLEGTLVGSVAIQSSVAGVLSISASLLGTISGQSSVAGSLSTQGLEPLAGAIDGQSSVLGTLLTKIGIASSIVIQSSVAGTINIVVFLSGAANAYSVVSGLLTVEEIYPRLIGLISSESFISSSLVVTPTTGLIPGTFVDGVVIGELG